MKINKCKYDLLIKLITSGGGLYDGLSNKFGTWIELSDGFYKDL